MKAYAIETVGEEKIVHKFPSVMERDLFIGLGPNRAVIAAGMKTVLKALYHEKIVVHAGASE